MRINRAVRAATVDSDLMAGDISFASPAPGDGGGGGFGGGGGATVADPNDPYNFAVDFTSEKDKKKARKKARAAQKKARAAVRAPHLCHYCRPPRQTVFC